VESVRAKLLRKAYKRPKSQLTDRLGVRVIVYYGADVDSVAAFLRTKLEIRERDSADKRLSLGLREFGYRSYHLVGRLPDRACAQPDLRILKGQVFEIQIRSLLEHAWAEIEHGVVYKSGAQLPDNLRRRFASLAGVLELLEHDFGAVRAETEGLVQAAVAEMRRGLTARHPLDVPRMLAVLELMYPDGLSFREARRRGEAFPPGIEQRLCLALQRAGIETTGSLVRALSDKELRRSLRRYAESEALTVDELSHLAVLAVLLGWRSPQLFRVFFPEFAADVSMRQALS
jgi:ppGpp synthetase/RelA/SpoT-type nucleotidyltranferase